MRKTYKLIDLDCAHCAAKMEAAIQKIDGVSEASVSFLTQKLTVEAEDGRFEEIGGFPAVLRNLPGFARYPLGQSTPHFAAYLVPIRST